MAFYQELCRKEKDALDCLARSSRRPGAFRDKEFKATVSKLIDCDDGELRLAAMQAYRNMVWQDERKFCDLIMDYSATVRFRKWLGSPIKEECIVALECVSVLFNDPACVNFMIHTDGSILAAVVLCTLPSQETEVIEAAFECFNWLWAAPQLFREAVKMPEFLIGVVDAYATQRVHNMLTHVNRMADIPEAFKAFRENKEFTKQLLFDGLRWEVNPRLLNAARAKVFQVVFYMTCGMTLKRSRSKLKLLHKDVLLLFWHFIV